VYRGLIAFEAVQRKLHYAMTNNFGFGNTNGSMVLEAIHH